MEMTFEQAQQRIQDITELIASSAITIEESVVLYREASELLVFCSDIIANAKLQIDEVTVTLDEYR